MISRRRLDSFLNNAVIQLVIPNVLTKFQDTDEEGIHSLYAG